MVYDYLPFGKIIVAVVEPPAVRRCVVVGVAVFDTPGAQAVVRDFMVGWVLCGRDSWSFGVEV